MVKQEILLVQKIIKSKTKKKEDFCGLSKHGVNNSMRVVSKTGKLCNAMEQIARPHLQLVRIIDGMFCKPWLFGSFVSRQKNRDVNLNSNCKNERRTLFKITWKLKFIELSEKIFYLYPFLKYWLLGYGISFYWRFCFLLFK